MPGRLKTGQAPGEKWHSIAVLMPLAAEGISWALSGFAAGRRLNQHSETALCLLFPVRRSAAIRFCPVGVCSASMSAGRSDPAPIRYNFCIETLQYYSLLNIASVYAK